MGKPLGKPNERGIYRTEIGGKRFYLGDNEEEAERRKSLLERLYEAADDQWTPLAHKIGLALARGEKKLTVEPEIETINLEHPVTGEVIAMPESDFEAALWLAEVQQKFPVITLRLADADKQAKSEKAMQRKAMETMEQGRSMLTRGGVGTILDAYAEHVRDTYHVQGKMTAYGVVLLKRIELLRDHHKTVDLEAWLSHWASRPMRKNGKPMSRSTCVNQIKTIRAIGRYLKRPVEARVRVKWLSEESRHKVKVPKFSREQIRTLHEYATPLERLLLMLAMNTGFGKAEIADLALNEVDLKGGFIKRIRRKTGVYGEWQLWPETVAGLQWFLSQRPKTGSGKVFVTKNGRPYYEQTKSGNPNQNITNAWAKLLKRLKKDQANDAFPMLSFNKLRKTSGSMIRRKFNGEIMRIHHARGQSVETDDQAEAYSDRPFHKVFKAQRWLGRHLALPPKPWEDTSKPSIPLGVRKRMQELRNQGHSLKQIANLMNSCVDTVCRHTKPPAKS